MKRLPLILASCASLFLPPLAQSQTFESTLGLPTLSLTLQDVIRRVLENSLDVKIERLNVDVAQQQTRAAAGRFDPYYYLSGSYSYSRLAQNAIEFAQTGGVFVPVGSDPYRFRQQNYFFETGLGGRIPLGTQYYIFSNLGRYGNDLNRNRPPALYYPEYEANVGVSLVQPLLKDFGKDIQLAEIRITRRNHAIADYKWETTLQRTLSDAIMDYMDLSLVMENIAMKRKVLAYVRDLGDRVKKRIAEGGQSDMAPLDIDWAISVAEEDVVKAMTVAADRQVKLKTLIMANREADPGLILLAKDPLRMISVRTDREALVQEALRRRPDYLAALEEIGKNEVLTRYMANQKLPRLDLQTSVSANGLSGSAGSAYERAGQRQGYEAQIGFRFSIPLGNDTAKANHASAQYLYDQAVLNKARSELGVSSEITSLIARVKGAQARLNTVRKSVKLAEDTDALLNKSSATGSAGFGVVLRGYAQLTDARIRYLEALLEYNRAAVQLTLASGLLLEKYNIHLDRQGPTLSAKSVSNVKASKTSTPTRRSSR